jgi:DNA-binding PadR family transcriptional regulator
MKVEAPALRNLLSMLLLSVLAERSLHGYAITDALQQAGQGQFRINQGAVYPALQRLEHLGLVSSSMTLSLLDGRMRRIYSITPQGRDQLTACWEGWQEFTAAVSTLLDSSPAGHD